MKTLVPHPNLFRTSMPVVRVSDLVISPTDLQDDRESIISNQETTYHIPHDMKSEIQTHHDIGTEDPLDIDNLPSFRHQKSQSSRNILA